MIFAISEDGSACFLMLAEEDITTMREGRTKFIDERFTKGHTFRTAIVSLHKTNQEAADILRRSGAPAMSATEQPHEMYTVKPGEGVCTGCLSFLGEPLLFETLCTVCWANLAKGFKVTVYCRQKDLPLIGRGTAGELFKERQFTVHTCTGQPEAIAAAWQEQYGDVMEMSPAGLGPIEPLPLGRKP